MNLEGRLSVVTGAAAGIGQAIATGLAAAGVDVVLADIDGSGLATTAARVEELGRDATAVVCDVTRDQEIAKLADAARRHGRAVTVVVANAGVAVGGQFEHIPAAEWQRILEVNVIGVVRTINAFLPGMLDRADGVVAITSSVQGLISESPTMTPYVTTKAALVGLARSLASYTRPRGVNTVLLCPSLTRTAFPNSARMWGPAGAATRSMNLPDWADTPEQVAELLIATLRADTFLASAVADLADRLHAWASDPDAALPSAPPSAGGAR